MGRQTVVIRKGRRKKTDAGTGYHTCGRCNGTGRVRDAGRPKKK